MKPIFPSVPQIDNYDLGGYQISEGYPIQSTDYVRKLSAPSGVVIHMVDNLSGRRLGLAAFRSDQPRMVACLDKTTRARDTIAWCQCRLEEWTHDLKTNCDVVQRVERYSAEIQNLNEVRQ